MRNRVKRAPAERREDFNDLAACCVYLPELSAMLYPNLTNPLGQTGEVRAHARGFGVAACA